MGFQGYYQLICIRGHYFERDCGRCDTEVQRCPICYSKVVWWNLVDTTNNEGRPIELEILVPELRRACHTCCHVSISRHAIYDIPLGQGHCISEHTDLDSGHDAAREEDQVQVLEERDGDHSRLPGD